MTREFERKLKSAIQKNNDFQELRDKIRNFKDKMGLDTYEITISEIGTVLSEEGELTKSVLLVFQRMLAAIPEQKKVIQEAIDSIKLNEKLFIYGYTLVLKISDGKVEITMRGSGKITEHLNQTELKERLDLLSNVINNKNLAEEIRELKLKLAFRNITEWEARKKVDVWVNEAALRLYRNFYYVENILEEQIWEFEKEVEKMISNVDLKKQVEIMQQEKGAKIQATDMPF